MTIDPKTGDLLLGTESVGPGLQEPEFLMSAIGRMARIERKAPKVNWYEFWLPGDLGREIAIVLGFECEGGMLRASIQFVKSDVRAAGASGWSPGVEDEMKNFHDGWLREQFGDPPYDFPWARVVSFHDPHDYSAAISVLYGPKR